MSENEIEEMEKKLQENILAIAAKNREIKRLKEELENSNDQNGLEETNKKLKKMNEEDQKEINELLEKIFDLQTTLSKQTEEIRVLTEENKKLKQTNSNNNKNIMENENDDDEIYEISFRCNNEIKSGQFKGYDTIGKLKDFVKAKLGISNFNLFTPFPRKVYDDDNATLQEVGLSKREMLNVALI